MTEFTLLPASIEQKDIITIYGLKGVGKTTLAMLLSYPGSMLGISFDRKTLRCKTNFYDDGQIEIYDATKYLKNNMEDYRDSAVDCYDYTSFLLTNAKEADWVLLDGGEIMVKLCEQKMRKEHNLKPFQGFATLTWWNERNMFLRSIHDMAKAKARKGVIYTIFSQIQEVEDFISGVKNREVPRWMDAATWETDVVLHAVSHVDDKNRKRMFNVEVTSSKILRFPTGNIYDTTGHFKSGWEGVQGTGEKFSELFGSVVGWYGRRGLSQDKLLAYYRSDGNGNIDEQKWIGLAAKHKEDAKLLADFIKVVNL